MAPHRRCGRQRLTDAEYTTLVLRGATVPCAFPRKNGSFVFRSLLPTSVRPCDLPFTYRTEPVRWLAAAHAAGLCPALCGTLPGVVHLVWSNEKERQAREYARDIASVL